MRRTRRGRGIVARQCARLLVYSAYAAWALAFLISIYPTHSQRAADAAIYTMLSASVVWVLGVMTRILWRERTMTNAKN